MNFLLKPHQYSKVMEAREATEDQFVEMVEHPQVIPDKSRAPLAIYGTMVPEPELDVESGLPRCTGNNVESIHALQLDYDSGMSVDEFRERYSGMRWHLYTSHGYKYKQGADRFRVVVPLETPLPCDLLNCARVRSNIEWNFPGIDTSCAVRGHFQICACVREPGAPYRFMHNDGERWGGDAAWACYRRWKDEDDARNAALAEAARNRPRLADDDTLLYELNYELSEVPVNAGVRHDSAKRILARYAHKGIAHLLPSVPCPWQEPGWEREWQNLTQWASTLK